MTFSEQYELLCKASGSMGNSSRLYLGDDHILVIDGTGYTERYRRFQYDKIQAICVQETGHSNVLTGVILLMLLILAGVSTLFETSNGQMIFLACTTLPLAIGLAVHIRAGKSCVGHMSTAVSQIRLGALNRVGKARHAAARMEAKILEAQRELAEAQAQAAAAGHEAADQATQEPPPADATADAAELSQATEDDSTPQPAAPPEPDSSES
jgi:hypothetical protein